VKAAAAAIDNCLVRAGGRKELLHEILARAGWVLRRKISIQRARRSVADVHGLGRLAGRTKLQLRKGALR
jgi:hypothetical protein